MLLLQKIHLYFSPNYIDELRLTCLNFFLKLGTKELIKTFVNAKLKFLHLDYLRKNVDLKNFLAWSVFFKAELPGLPWTSCCKIKTGLEKTTPKQTVYEKNSFQSIA